MRSVSLKPLNWIEMAALLGLSLLLICYFAFAGAFSGHMILHIALMAGVAPVLASRLRHARGAKIPTDFRGLLAATLAQLIIFFAWHTPIGMAFAMANPLGGLVMQLSLLAVATWFWLCILTRGSDSTWPAVIALIVTGKLYCLLAVLLVFAPRELYGMAHMPGHGAVAVADQQLAGLLMILACPLTYVFAALVLVARWLKEHPDAPVQPAPPQRAERWRAP